MLVTTQVAQVGQAVSTQHMELQTLIRDSHGLLVKYLYSHFTRNSADAHDIAQEAYLRICKHTLDPDKPIEHLRGLLFTTAKNLAIDWHRQGTIREHYLVEQTLRGAYEHLSPEDVWISREDWAQMQSAIAQLPPKTQLALRMVREEGLSYQDVATRIGIRIHSARRLVERATKLLVKRGLQS